MVAMGAGSDGRAWSGGGKGLVLQKILMGYPRFSRKILMGGSAKGLFLQKIVKHGRVLREGRIGKGGLKGRGRPGRDVGCGG
jgi:hypothetical protein